MIECSWGTKRGANVWKNSLTALALAHYHILFSHHTEGLVLSSAARFIMGLGRCSSLKHSQFIPYFRPECSGIKTTFRALMCVWNRKVLLSLENHSISWMKGEERNISFHLPAWQIAIWSVHSSCCLSPAFCPLSKLKIIHGYLSKMKLLMN